MATVDDLLRQLREPDYRERIEAARALAAHPDDERVVPALRAALSDPEDTAVTEAAMFALLAIASDDAIKALQDSLTNDDEAADHLALFLDVAGQHGSTLADEVLSRYRDA